MDVPSTYARARELTIESLPVAVVPALASLAAIGEIRRAVESPPGGGVTFPLPTGLATLWTYTDVPGGPGTVAGSLSVSPSGVAAAAVGVVFAGALEAGFLGTLDGRIDGDPITLDRFALAVRRFGVRLIGVQVVRLLAVVAVVFVGQLFVPLAFLGSLAVGYLLYGWPFVVVVRDESLTDTLGVTLGLATESRSYVWFAVGHLVCGALASVPLTGLVRNTGLAGVVIGIAVVAVPAVFVGCYGLLVFREAAGGSRESDRV